MSEIPLTPSEEYRASSSSGSRTKIIAIIVIVVIVVGGVGAVVLMDNSSPVYDTRQIASWTDADPDPSTVTYYRNEFTTSSAETATNLPYLHAVVTIDNGYDTGSVGIEFHVYECSMAIVDAAATWAELAIYKEGDRSDFTSLNERISLQNDPSTYTWVLIFTYTGTKSATWDCDMTITLEY